MPQELWQLVWLLTGAAISVLTTLAFNKYLEYEQRKKLAFSLFMKAYSATDDVSRIRRDLHAQLALFRAHRGRDPAPEELWTAVTPFVFVGRNPIAFAGEELALFENDGEAISKLLEFVSARQLLLESVHIYGEKRKKLSDVLDTLTTYATDASGMVGTTSINFDARPDLRRAIGETNKLCRDIFKLADEVETAARRICDLINQKIPSKFRKADFTTRLEMPRAS